MFEFFEIENWNKKYHRVDVIFSGSMRLLQSYIIE